MNDTLPHVEDVRSVGSRVSWSALFAGAVLAFSIYFLLMVLGSAVGMSLRNRVNSGPLHTGTVVWSLLTFCVAVFCGGLVTSLFTVGENKVESVVYGILMWGLVVAMLVLAAGVGVHAGLVAMAYSPNPATNNWEATARDAGVPADQIEAWRKTRTDQPVSEADRKTAEENVTRLTWYAFLGTWVSMMAAALGAWLGAGPTFRLVVVRAPTRVMPG